MRKLTVFAALLALAAGAALTPVRAQMALVTDNERVAMADLIVVGTVTSAKALDGVPSFAGGEITINVTTTLKGTAPTPLRVRHPVPPQMPPGVMISDHGGLRFDVGARRLFFLTKFLDVYTVVGGGQGALADTEAEKYAALIAKPPATISLAALAGPLVLGDKVKVSCTITNNGKVPLEVWGPMLVGYVLGADHKTPVYVMAREDAAVPAPKGGYGKVPAGDKLDLTITLLTNGRQAGDLPAAGVKWPARLNLFLMPEGGQPGAGWTAHSTMQEVELKPPAPPTQPVEPPPPPR